MRTNAANMEEAGILEKITRSGFCYPALNQVDFQAASPEVLDALPTRYSQQPVSLMTLNFQQFDDVSLMAAQGISCYWLPADHDNRPCSGEKQ
jgi:hypothetical protein